ncbi:uncharacterized protein LOC106767960 isoform X2 [Vigna radiata var. radiata]|uniref:Uncharacterized protein LOC106767960 isoform X2 n=1 Tax=Vigna radiata var. radiata TaxID=3916 RepID=A0A1S3UQX3_VIGRR|nr:uncharacterized protein LOC106767960 isoform X2 [Vigna radiata var. radiata]
MEFKFRHGENRSTSTLLPQQRTLALPTVPLVSGHPLRGGFPGIIPTTRMYPTSVPISPEEVIRREMEREQIRREMEKDEIRREILANEMARRMELEEEVRRELMSERALKMPIHRMEGINYGSLSMIPGRRLHNSVHNSNIFGGPQPQLAPHKVDITQFYKQTPNETLTNEPNFVLSGPKCKEVFGNVLSGVKHKEVLDVNAVKRKLEASFRVDDKHSESSLEKKTKKDWSCALCHIVTTSEKGLNDHLQGKKHKMKEASRTPTIGLVRRQDGEKLQSGMKPAYKGKLEPLKMDLVVQKTQDLGDTDNENESTTEEKVQKTKALTTRKKFNFYCAFCQVRTHSEIIMQNHKNGKKHLANIKKHNPNSSVDAVCAAENSE